MPTREGVAGRSARAGYRSARRRRRADAVACSGLALAALAGAAAAVAGPAAWHAALWVVAAVAAVAAWRARPDPDPERWLRGAGGEEATAAVLDRLPRRWAVLHDRRVPGSRANIDHLVIGPRGVWVVDSKAYRARLRAGWRVVRAGDRPIDTGSAEWQASVVADLLDVDVRALVAVHGDGLARRGRRVGGARVVPVAGLRRRLLRRRGSARIGRREVADLAALAAVELPEA